jgi:pyruvate/2-oxoglutarate/acetoin dehydrogenase E1 component
LDDTLILESVKKTGRLVVCDHASYTGGFAGEIISRVTEKAFSYLKEPPIRITFPDAPVPTTRGLANYYYPTTQHIENAVKRTLGIKTEDPFDLVHSADYLDIPDQSFKGPF